MKLLLDEMYSAAIAEALRDRGHDAVSVHERVELVSASDAAIFASAQAERRTIVTNNVRDFAPLARDAFHARELVSGLIYTNDRALPRSREAIGAVVGLLDAVMAAHPEDGAFDGRVSWLSPDVGY